MSEMEVIIRQESGVLDHQSKSPPTVGLKAGAFAEVGTLILTNKRLVYISKGGAARALAWGVGGVFMAQAIEKTVSKAEIDEAATQKGSYYTPLQNITLVEAAKKLGQSYIRVDSTGTNKPVHAYVVSGGNNNQAWATAINQAKNTPQYTPPIQTANTTAPTQNPTPQNCQRCGTPTTNNSKFCTTCGTPLTQNIAPAPPTMPVSPPPPPPPTQTPMCPYCRNPIRFIPQYQRWYCDNERRYI